MIHASDRLAKSIGSLEKALTAKDYSRLVPVKKQDSTGKMTTYWVLPDDAKQQNLFDSETGGKESISGSRGYHDHVDQGINDAVVKPLIDKVRELDPELATKFEYKYQNYPWDRDTKELDVKADLDTVWYLKKFKDNPDYREEWQEEYNEKMDRTIKQINNRKKAMLKKKPGDVVKYRGKDAVITEFSKRGFPILDIGGKKEHAFWEEVA